MRKGCFVKFIIILTVLLAAVIYVVQTRFDDIVLSPGKKIIKNALNDSWQEELQFVKSSPEKDSVKLLLENFIDDIKSINDVSEKQVEQIKSSIEYIVIDSLIDSNELMKLKSLIRTENISEE